MIIIILFTTTTTVLFFTIMESLNITMINIKLIKYSFTILVQLYYYTILYSIYIHTYIHTYMYL